MLLRFRLIQTYSFLQKSSAKKVHLRTPLPRAKKAKHTSRFQQNSVSFNHSTLVLSLLKATMELTLSFFVHLPNLLLWKAYYWPSVSWFGLVSHSYGFSVGLEMGCCRTRPSYHLIYQKNYFKKLGNITIIF